MSFNVPFTKYLINDGNNEFSFEDLNTGIEKSFRIENGDYNSIDEIKDELNAKAADSTISAPFRFETNYKQQKLILVTSSAVPTKIIVKGPLQRKNDYEQLSLTYKSKLMKLLGFDLEDHELDLNLNNEYTLPYKVDLRKDEYIIMNLGKSSVNYSENTHSNKSFALIKKDDLANKFIDANYKKYYNPPVPALSTLDISFTDYDGNLYDFQNQDHLIELEFCCFKNQRKYTDIYAL